MAMMEGLTHHIMGKHDNNPAFALTLSHQHQPHHKWLQNQAWEGNSYIGNIPKQATYYYGWMCLLTAVNGGDEKHVCKIGVNGFHSVLIVLTVLAKANADDYDENCDHGEDEIATSRGRCAKNKLTIFDLCSFEYDIPK